MADYLITNDVMGHAYIRFYMKPLTISFPLPGGFGTFTL